MKTKRVISLFAATLSLALAASVSAAPASKRIWTSKSPAADQGTASSKVEHKVMKRVGPMGKGYVCTH